MNRAIHHLELSESIFQKAVQEGSAEFVKVLFKLGVTIPKYNVEVQRAHISIMPFLIFTKIEPLCSAWLLPKNRGHAAPPIGKLSNSKDILMLVSEMITGYPKFKIN